MKNESCVAVIPLAVENARLPEFKRSRPADCQRCSMRRKMLFADIDLPAVSELLGAVNSLQVKRGATLYRQGEAGIMLYAVRKGLVKLTQSGADGYQRIVHIAGPGTCIGLEGFLETCYHQTAEALTDVDICAIPVLVADRIAAQQPVFYRALLQRWQQQFATAERWMMELSQGTVRQKLARLLLMLDDIGHTEGQLRLLSNLDSAGILSTTMETVSRHVAEFKRAGTLAKVAPALYRIDRSGLQQAADCPE